jgi:hypothetical protein
VGRESTLVSEQAAAADASAEIVSPNKSPAPARGRQVAFHS